MVLESFADFNTHTAQHYVEKEYPNHFKTWAKHLIRNLNVFKQEIIYTSKIITQFAGIESYGYKMLIHSMVYLLWSSFNHQIPLRQKNK